MKNIEMIKTRFTSKKYDAEYNLADNVKADLMEVLRYSPSAINAQPWRFYFIENQDVKAKLSEVSKHNTEKVRDCNFMVVFTALKHDEFLKQFNEYGHENAIKYYDKNMTSLSKEEVEAWILNQVYLSLGFALAALGNEDIHSTALEGIEPAKYEEILGVDTSKERVVLALTVGRSTEGDKGQPQFFPKMRIGADVIIKEIL